MDAFDIVLTCVGFEWDELNAEKIWDKHHISPSECEEIFFNRPLVIADDVKHSDKELRFYSLGQTDMEKMLFVVFTVRQDRIRVISARKMNRKERKVYQSNEPTDTKV